MAKDGHYVKDKLSDHVIGMLLLAKIRGDIKQWETNLFQVPFKMDMKFRASADHYGHPFIGPDNKILTLNGRCLKGASTEELAQSRLEFPELDGPALEYHPGYDAWINRVLFAGHIQGVNGTTYTRTGTNNTKKDCDASVNKKPYQPGPQSQPPGAVPSVPATNGSGGYRLRPKNERRADESVT